MLENDMLLMNDAFKERMGEQQDTKIVANIFSNEELVLQGNFVSLTSADDKKSFVLVSTDFWKTIDLSINIQEFRNLSISLNDKSIFTVSEADVLSSSVERQSNNAKLTIYIGTKGATV